MLTAIMTFIGFLAGGILVFAILSKASRQWREIATIRDQNAQKSEELRKSQSEFEQTVKKKQKELAQAEADLQARIRTDTASLEASLSELERAKAAFSQSTITYADLQTENVILKQDLRNIDVNLLKLEMDRDLQAETQARIAARSAELAEKYLSDVEKWVAGSINANNYAACKQRLTKAIEWCREIGFEVSADRERDLLTALKTDYEEAVRAALEREEQARIKAQIREEQLREREVERELATLERERAAIKAALDKAMADAQSAHSDEVSRLQERLAEAEARSQRAISQAQLTRAGHIYVISNIGAFGEQVFKIGMTRRLEPKDRIAELGDASVPFPFDVHMMISCDDAPALENKLHRNFARHRMNKVNMRKEFFKVGLEDIKRFVVENHGEVNFIADAEALQYRQSLTMSAEDEAYIEQVFEDAEQAIGVRDSED